MDFPSVASMESAASLDLGSGRFPWDCWDSGWFSSLADIPKRWNDPGIVLLENPHFSSLLASLRPLHSRNPKV